MKKTQNTIIKTKRPALKGPYDFIFKLPQIGIPNTHPMTEETREYLEYCSEIDKHLTSDEQDKFGQLITERNLLSHMGIEMLHKSLLNRYQAPEVLLQIELATHFLKALNFMIGSFLETRVPIATFRSKAAEDAQSLVSRIQVAMGPRLSAACEQRHSRTDGHPATVRGSEAFGQSRLSDQHKEPASRSDSSDRAGRRCTRRRHYPRGTRTNTR